MQVVSAAENEGVWLINLRFVHGELRAFPRLCIVYAEPSGIDENADYCTARIRCLPRSTGPPSSLNDDSLTTTNLTKLTCAPSVITMLAGCFQGSFGGSESLLSLAGEGVCMGIHEKREFY